MSEPINEFEEMYLKRLYEFYILDPQKPIRNRLIAEAMGVSQASSSEVIHRLASNGLVYHIPYRGATLTQDGVSAAAKIKRREGLMEVFLVNMLDYQGDVNKTACRLEHALTENLERAIDRLLGYPELTPSGEKIPMVGRHLEPNSSKFLIPLSSLKDGSSGSVELIVLDSSNTVTLQKLGLITGAIISYSDNQYLVGEASMEIGPDLASNILIRVQ
tara:strand:- start:3176 stop:3826 length:651 start_codon:yes stop_codon:yes gene_type:complete